MRKTHCNISQAKLKELFKYDPKTGVFTRVKPAKGGIYAGSILVKGSDNGLGYLRIWLEGKQHCLHVLAWVYMTGKSPEGFIDHIDRNKKNNVFENLREVTRSENNCNRGIRSDSVTGVHGVGIEYGKFRVRLQLNKKRVFFGYYDDLELAQLVAEEARAKYHGEFAYAPLSRS